MSKAITRTSLMVNFFLITLATSVNVLFGLLKFANALDIRFYYFYSPKAVDIVIFSPSIDFWMWIASLLFTVLEMFLMKITRNPSLPHWTVLPCLFSLGSLTIFSLNETIAYLLATPLGFIMVALLIYYGDGYLVTRREEAASLTLFCVAGLLILFEVASAISWALNAFQYEFPFSPTPRWKFPWLDLQLFNLLYPLTSWLFLIFLYSWIWIPASKYILSRIPALKQMLLKIGKNILTPVQNTDSKSRLDNKFIALVLLLSLATSAFIAYYPHFHLPSSTLAGADSTAYYDWIKEMMQKGPLTAFEKDRPLFNLLIYSINYLVGSPETVIRIMPIILAVCLNLAVFWFVKVATGNERLALMSSLLSTFSFQTTLGVFAYFAANWFAIIETLLLMTFLLKYFQKRSWKNMAMSTLIGIALLLTHPYTWNAAIAILFAYSAWILLRRKPEEKIEITPLLLLLTTNLLFYAVYTLMPAGKGVSSAEAGVWNTFTSNIGLSSLVNLQNALASMVQIWVGGLLANPLLIILAVAGMFSIRDLAKRFNRLMLLWVLVPSLALLATPAELYYRIIYVIPMQIHAALGLYWIFNKVEDTNNFRTSDTFRALKISAITLILLLLLNCALRSVDSSVIQMVKG